MGCNGREKTIRTNRRPKSIKPDSMDNSIPKSINPQINELSQNPNPNFDDNGWGYCTEEQLGEILMKNLEFLYNESISKLVSLGFSEDIALRTILRNGHCYGGMDVLSNILHNCLAYLNSNGGDGNANGDLDESEPVFADLKQLEEYSLAGMVVLLQQVRPNLSKGDAMWCLLMSDLHVGRASTMEIPVIRPPSNGYRLENGKVENVSNNSEAMAPAPGLCKFHGGWGFGNNGGASELYANGGFSEFTLQKEYYFPKRFNLTPSMQSLMRENVAAFAAGFRANNSNHAQPRLHACPSSVSGGKMLSAAEAPIDKLEDSKTEDVVSAVLNKFHDLNIDENAELLSDEKKDEMILSLINHIKDMEKQVKDRKEWAHQKAMQAARKLSSDLTELKTLRMEREETQRLKKGKQTLEDSTVKKLSEMENALRKASGQVDRANAAVRRLETENAEIKAEMQASKLSASESVMTCLEVAKREKKYLKRLLAWEKQKSKVQEEIAVEKKNIMEMQLQLVQIEQDQKETEVKWREELNAKDVAVAQVEDEQRLKEAAESANKRKLEILRLNIEIDFKRHKDDLQRLEQELSRLKTANEETVRLQPSAEVINPVTDFQEETIAVMLHDLNIMENSSENGERECMICMRDEVSIVFLPCAHQVLCANCNEVYGKKGKPGLCPCCRSPIEQRVRVFGVSS